MIAKGKYVRLNGWGGTPTALTWLHEPKSREEFQEIVGRGGQRGLLATGMQRSYGDSALNSGGITVSTRHLNVCEIDGTTGIVIAGAGVSIQELEVASLKKEYFPPVVPGTGFVTLGGAVAADIHGKSHHLTGSFSQAIRRIELLYADGSIRDLFPEGPTEKHFWATVGGLGLTGVILGIELQLVPIRSNQAIVEEVRCHNLESLMSELKNADREFAHTVAWIDLSGDFKGRGLVSKANYSEYTNSKSKTLIPPESSFPFPGLAGKNLINNKSVRLFNEMWFRKPLSKGLMPLTKYMHPLDKVTAWNRIYGTNGFLQYQFVIPEGSEDLIPKILSEVKKIGGASFLGVLKRFGMGNRAAMSFPIQGWTLAMDFPVELPDLEGLLNTFDQWVGEAGGRVYLVKDSRLKPSFVSEMYPGFVEWKKVRNQMDPESLWRSDQSRRLEIC